MRPPPKQYQPDYTTDLNALVRLEGKLPPHGWDSKVDNLWEMWGADFEYMGGGCAPTEAEARAEAICQYLESW